MVHKKTKGIPKDRDRVKIKSQSGSLRHLLHVVSEGARRNVCHESSLVHSKNSNKYLVRQTVGSTNHF